MVEAFCHCGAVRIVLPSAPSQVTACNCSICRRYGWLLAYYGLADVVVQGDTDTYSWGDHMLAFHRCKVCGCGTHWYPLGTPTLDRMGVNARLLPPDVLARACVRRFDGAETWTTLGVDPPPASGRPPTLDHVIVKVRDLGPSIAFYTTILGFSDEGRDGPFAVLRVGPDVQLLLAPYGTEGGEHYAFAVSRPDFEAIFGRIRAAAIPHGPRFDAVGANTEPGSESGARGLAPTVYFNDPNGHLLEIRTYAS